MPTTIRSPRISYALHGTEGPGVLLIMGLGMNGDVWRPQVERLGPDHRIATFDHRGVGASEAPPGLWTVRDLAGDARAVLDAAGFDRAHVVGVSLGGMVAQELALAAPERVRSLALLATHAGGRSAWIGPPRGLLLFARTLAERRSEARLRALSRLLYPEHFVASCPPERLRARLEAQTAGAPPLAVALRQAFAAMRHDAADRLGAIRCPTLVVRPGLDMLVDPRHAERLARLVPGAELLRLDDAGHGVVFQHADRLDEELRRHFARAS